MTTKAQEREALQKIQKIVAGLGENSYIGTAFEGCFDLADQNIEYDAAFTKQRIAAADSPRRSRITDWSHAAVRESLPARLR